MSRFRPLRKNNLRPVLALALGAGLLAACSSASTITAMAPTAAGGLPTNVPARPATEPEYPAVNAMPQRRDALPLTDEEVKRAQAELTTLRQPQRSGLTPRRNPPRRRPKRTLPVPNRPKRPKTPS